ncbi:hypothetical protein CYLTODRAFT_422132 [Cylindrobasidium torrendii FP15055 ss-10]|uniref:Uncharacterized protein n=1 Tax=Cylindrobasidium torrendii FP15055 ss-10 TaxID=1314674 RepID=A0A0D7BBN6_9AGAR|nr:hypothetical protein CYLTODRAFT_422132 [Cylindrobasidium torrendii FP15055 ss-10]
MATPYTEDCISFNGVFEEPIGFPIITDHQSPFMRRHELGSGMKRGETTNSLYEPGNYLYLQRDFGARAFLNGHAFVPLNETLQAMADIYQKNQQCLYEDRARIKINIGALECTFVAASTSRPLFLRHPITGIITKHEHPYPAFPTIRLRTADPIMVASKACYQLSTSLKERRLLEQFRRAQDYFFRNPPIGWFSRANCPAISKPPLIPAPPSAIASSLTPSHCVRRPAMSTTAPGTQHARLRKRQRDTAPSGECPPTKRPRRTPCIPLRRNPPRAAKTMARANMAPPARKHPVT